MEMLQVFAVKPLSRTVVSSL